MDELTQEFLNEASESLLELDSQMVELENDPNNPDLISGIFRVMHTIKGTSGFIGLNRLGKVAHAAENLLDKFREGAEVTSSAVSVILSAIDTIKELIDGIEKNAGVEPEGNDAMLIDLIEEFAAGVSNKKVEENSLINEQPVSLEVNSDKVVEASAPLETALPASGDKDVKQSSSNQNQSSNSNQTVRISVTLLDELMDLVGELVLSRNQIQQIERNINVNELSVPVQNLSHVASELQESVMRTRMQPIGVAFKAYPRIVRDLANDLGKKIELVRLGEETEMDRQILEMIKDPLTHMVRNCADHALEPPEERLASGKGEVGTITLQAYHEGGHIIINIKDDGRGIPVEKISKKAIEKGVITQSQLDGMSPNQIRGLIFHPGFSTAETVTSVSGRGVGMDVVKTNIEKIGGTISVDSEEGAGTVFSIKIPLTLAIVSAFIVKTGTQKFAIPQLNVIEIVNSKQKGGDHRIEKINNVPMLRLREQIYPMISLSEVMEIEESEENTILVCQVGSDTFGIMVSSVLDTEEIVVKGTSKVLQEISLYSGNTILGDGSVIMILDPNGLYSSLGSISKTGDNNQNQVVDNKIDTSDSIQMLVFSSGGKSKKAVHLAVVARLEQIKTSNIKVDDAGSYLVQYRNNLMPIVACQGFNFDEKKEYQNIIVFIDNGRSMGLMVDEIEEIIETTVNIDISSKIDGVIGNAIIGEESTEVIDVSYYLQKALGDWFKKTNNSISSPESGYNILLVDDSQFFRNMLKPIIESRGYNVTTAENAIKALKLIEHNRYDVIISDIEMPEMNGLEFVKILRENPITKGLPIAAVSSHTNENDIQKGMDAGFTDYMPKMDRERLFDFLTINTVGGNFESTKKRA